MPYYYGIDWSYIVYVLPALILAMWAQHNVTSTFKKYSRVPSAMTGAEAARLVLRGYGIGDVGKYAESHAGQHGRAQRGIAALGGAQGHAQHIRGDLAPKGAFGAAADEGGFCVVANAAGIQYPFAVQQRQGNALHHCSGKVGLGVAGPDAGEAAAEHGVTVGGQFAVEIGVVQKTFASGYDLFGTCVQALVD